MKTSGAINLSGEIENELPAELVGFLRAAGEAAQLRGQGLYLVGGVVRDLLLKRSNLDLDLVVEGDAIGLAGEMARANQGKLTTHSRFGTAKVRWGEWSADLATARSETYSRPGALPGVKPGSIKADLSRRDFTINAMAVELNPESYGRLLDLYGGRDDLERGFIRVLHENSFIDDATRIWRGLRYEQRLDFEFEPDTLKLLERDIAMLDTISGDRIRHELELVLKENLPQKAVLRAGELGVLSRLHPALKGDGWLAERFVQARRVSHPEAPSVSLYLALLAYRLDIEEAEQVISSLRLPKPVAQALRDTISLKVKLGSLADPGLSPSAVYSLLHGYVLTAVTANLLAADSPVVRERIELFLNKLRYVKPALTGNDLRRLGLAPGPGMKEILERLRTARLDGEVSSKKDEEEMVKQWLGRRV